MNSNLSNSVYNTNAIISFLRFPMAALVILWHSDAVYLSDIKLRYDTGIAESVLIACSWGICQISVPAFALISGFLFFGKMQVLDVGVWLLKLKRRIKSLFVPYIMWNLIAFLWMVVYTSFVSGDICIHQVYSMVGGVRMFWDGWCNLPVDGPLWYIRELIIITFLLSIPIFALIKYTKLLGVVILGFMYIFDLWPQLSWLHIQMIFFFSLGAYYKLGDKEMFEHLYFYRRYIYLLSVILFFLMIITYNIHQCNYFIYHHIFTIVGVISTFFISYKLIRYNQLSKRVNSIGNSSFFVYAAHRFAIIDIVRVFLQKIVPNSQMTLIITYFATAVITFVCCHVVYLIIKKYSPKFLSLLVGGR